MVTATQGRGVVTGDADDRGHPAMSISLPERKCFGCGVTLPAHKGRGAPRKICVDCNDGHGRLKGLPRGRRRYQRWCEACGSPFNSEAAAEVPTSCRVCRRAVSKEVELARRRLPPHEAECTECSVKFVGRKDQLVCSRRCKDRRYCRLHPVEYAAKQHRKYLRRKARIANAAAQADSGGLQGRDFADARENGRG